MVLKLYGSALSTCTKRVVTVLAEKKVDYELITIDFAKAEHKSAAYLQKQPFGKIPYLDDDGFIVFESRAIARYIATKYASQGTQLVPAANELKALAIFEQGVSVENNYFNPAAEGIAVERAFKKYRGLESDEELVKQHAAALDTALAGYESILSRQKYIGGNEISLADLFHLPYGDLARKLGFKETFDKYPHVAKWFEELEKRESWIKANA